MVNFSDLASQAIRVILDIDYISPVMAVVEVILEVSTSLPSRHSK